MLDNHGASTVFLIVVDINISDEIQITTNGLASTRIIRSSESK